MPPGTALALATPTAFALDPAALGGVLQAFDWVDGTPYDQVSEDLGGGSTMTVSGNVSGIANDDVSLAVSFPSGSVVLTGRARRIRLSFRKAVSAVGCEVSGLVGEPTDFTLNVRAFNTAGTNITPFGAARVIRASSTPDDPMNGPRFAGIVSRTRNIAAVEFQIVNLPGRPLIRSLVLGSLSYRVA